jgi:hypothetical protein
MQPLVVQVKLSGSGLDRPGQDLNQGRFPGAVFSDQGMHAPAVEGHRNIVKGASAGIIFGDMLGSYLLNAHAASSIDDLTVFQTSQVF